MFSLLHVCSYVAAAIAFLFVTLSLASGLLYIAELVEEHSKLAKTVGQRLIYIVCLLHILFCISDGLPVHLTALGIICHLVYLQNFSKTWPFISLTSAKFVASCILVIIDHFAWFYYFSDRAKAGHSNPAYSPRGYRSPSAYRTGSAASRLDPSNKYVGLRELTFMDVATFFGACVWLAPFFLFLSLSANDNVLPSLVEQTPQIQTTYAGDGSATPAHLQLNSITITGPRSSILKVALDPLLALIPRLGGSRNRSSRSQRDGIIASPRVMSSAPPSPGVYGTPLASAAGSPFGPSAASAWPQSPHLNSSSTATMGTGGPSMVGSIAYDPSSLSPQTPFGMRVAAAHSSTNTGSPPFLRQPPGSGGISKRSVTSPAISLGGQSLSLQQQQQQHYYEQTSQFPTSRSTSPLKSDIKAKDMDGSMIRHGNNSSPPPLTFRLTEAAHEGDSGAAATPTGNASGIMPVRSVSPLGVSNNNNSSSSSSNNNNNSNSIGGGGGGVMSRRKVTS